jgi:membrane protease YdiL (CAAX protease family)
MSITPDLPGAINVLRTLIVLVLVGIFATKTVLRSRLITALLILCTVFVGLAITNSTINKNPSSKGAAVMESSQSELMMRLGGSFKALSDSVPSAQSLSSDKSVESMYITASKSMEKAVEKDPESLPLRFKQTVLAAETGHPFKTELKALTAMEDKRAPQASALVDALYVKRKLPESESVAALKLIDELTSFGFYQDVLRLEVYKASGQTKLFNQKNAEYQDSNRWFALRIIGLMGVMCLAILVGVIVICVQLFKLPRNISDAAAEAEIRAPSAYGFSRVYGVLVGWLTLESFISPAVVSLVQLFKSGAKDPSVLALLTMTIYVVTNVPALLLAWLIAIKPTGARFFEAVKLRTRTIRRGPTGLVLAGVATWFACVPLVIAASSLAKKLLNSEGSTNPILTIVLEAVRSHNILAAVLFVIAIGVLPALCEEMLFRGFLYTSLRWKFGPFLSMLISAILFAAVHMDPGAFAQLFVLGFVFAFVMERTRSLIPSMVAHCMWNTGTFIVMMTVFG